MCGIISGIFTNAKDYLAPSGLDLLMDLSS